MDNKRKGLIFSLMLFAVSLFLPSFHIESPDNVNPWSPSFFVLILGWFSAIGGYAGTAWYANLLIIPSWYFITKKSVLSLVLSIIGFCLSLMFVFYDKLITNEAGTYAIISERKLGYYLWVSSFVVVIITNLVELKKKKSVT